MVDLGDFTGPCSPGAWRVAPTIEQHDGFLPSSKLALSVPARKAINTYGNVPVIQFSRSSSKSYSIASRPASHKSSPLNIFLAQSKNSTAPASSLHLQPPSHHQSFNPLLPLGSSFSRPSYLIQQRLKSLQRRYHGDQSP